MILWEKLNILENIIKKYMPIAVAYSGGVDSTFLLKKAIEIDKEKVLAINVDSSIMSSFERQESFDFLKQNNINHIIIKKDPFAIKEFVENPVDKCYYCKKQVFNMIINAAKEKGYSNVADGSNASDLNDYRPGMVALSELGVISPLKEAGLTKDEIRTLSMDMKLSTWDKPSNACLATRIMTGIEISEEDLKRIDNAEDYIRSQNIKQVRVRVHERDLARIELDEEGIITIMHEDNYKKVLIFLKKLGFKYITLDLEGYKVSGTR